MISKIANDTNVKEMRLNKDMENKELDVKLRSAGLIKRLEIIEVCLVKAIDSDFPGKFGYRK